MRFLKYNKIPIIIMHNRILLHLQNQTNYFHCPYNDDCIYAGINSFSQGLSNLIFSFIFYYSYMTLRLFSLKKDKFTIAMISLTCLIIFSLVLSLGEFLDYILFCSSELIYSIMYFVPLLFTTLIIYLFDYILCKGLSYSNTNNDNIKFEIEKKIYYIIHAKLPFLLLYVAIFIISFINFKSNLLNNVFDYIDCVYTIIYLFLYVLFLLLNLNFVEEIIKTRNQETYKNIHSQMRCIKIVLGIHFSTRIIWECSLNVVSTFFGYHETWYSILSNYCLDHGCIWHLLIIYIYKILIDLEVYVVFGLFVKQFVSTHLTMEIIINNNNNSQKNKLNEKLNLSNSFSSISLEELVKNEME